MKIIYTDNITAVTGDSEHANYPASNVQTQYVKEKWVAEDTDAELLLAVSSGSGVAVYGTNATSVTVTVSVGLGAAWAEAGDGHEGAEWGATGDGHEGADWVTAATVTTVYDLSGSDVGSLWADYTEYTGSHIVSLQFTATGENVEAGVVRSGTVNEFRDPHYGIREGLKDYSIIKELSNGAFYIKKRDVVRTFSFSLLEDRDADFYTFMHDIFMLYGSQPLAWRICSSKNTDWEWVVFCRADSMPSGSHGNITDSVISISLLEVV